MFKCLIPWTIQAICQIARESFDRNIRLSLWGELEDSLVGYGRGECVLTKKPVQKWGRISEKPSPGFTGLRQDYGKGHLLCLFLSTPKVCPKLMRWLGSLCQGATWVLSHPDLGLCLQQGGWRPLHSRVISASGRGGQDAPSWFSPDVPATSLIPLLTPRPVNSK